MIGFSTYPLFWLKKFNNSPCLFPGDGLGFGRVSICWEDPGLEFIVHGLSCSAHLVFSFGQQTGLVSFSCLFYPLSLVYLCLPSLLLVLHHGTIPPYSVLLCPTLSYHTPGLFYMVRPGVQPNWVEQHWPGGCRVAERRGLRGLARNTTDTRELCQTHNWSNIINHGPNKEIKL